MVSGITSLTFSKTTTNKRHGDINIMNTYLCNYMVAAIVLAETKKDAADKLNLVLRNNGVEEIIIKPEHLELFPSCEGDDIRILSEPN